MEEALSLKRILVLSWVYLIVLTLGAWVLHSWSLGWAVFVGGLISITSFWFSYRDLKIFLDSLAAGQADEPRTGSVQLSKRGFILKFWLRIFVIGLVLLALIASRTVNIFGLILGLTTVVLAITMSGLGVVWRFYFSRR